MRTRLLAFLLLLAVVATIVIASPHSSGKTTYLYKRGDSVYLNGNVSELENLGDYGNEFVWTRQNGRSYVITDPAVLATIRAAYAELDAKEKPYKDIERRLRPQERELERIEERVDELGDQLDDEDLSESKRAALERQLHDAEAEMRQVEARMRDVEKELERVEKEMDRLQDAAEERFERMVDQAIAAGKAKRVD